MAKMSVKEIKAALCQYTGTDQYHRHPFTGMLCTDGIKAMAEMCGGYWLVDAIASLQPKCRQDEKLRAMQFWTLKRKGKNWLLVCESDKGDVAFIHGIEYSDFPLNEIRIWVENGVMLLPSEYQGKSQPSGVSSPPFGSAPRGVKNGG